MRIPLLSLVCLALPSWSCHTVTPAGYGWLQDSLDGQDAGDPEAVPVLVPEGEATEEPAPSGPYPTGFLLGFRTTRSSVQDDFDGESILVGPSDAIAIPRFDEGSGQGFGLGYVFEGSSIEFYLDKDDLDGEFLGIDVQGTMRSCGIRTRTLAGPRLFADRLSPHIVMGLAVHAVTVLNGASNGVTVGDGELTGAAFELGLGASLAVNRYLILRADYILRCQGFTEASGLGSALPLGDDLQSIEPLILFGIDLVL